MYMSRTNCRIVPGTTKRCDPVAVTLTRMDGFDGPVRVKLEGLPAGLTAPETFVEAGHTTTAFTLEGQRVTRSLGVVRGITVRSRSIFGTIGGSLQTLIGGNITLFTELCEKTRHEAFQMMVAHAEQMGANAVIGVRYDATEVMQGVTEVLCYGTAVIVAPE